MNDPTVRPSRLRWFQVRLKALFALGLLVAVFCGGYAAATRRAEESVKADREARQKAEGAQQKAEEKLAGLNELSVVVYRPDPVWPNTEDQIKARKHDEALIYQAAARPLKTRDPQHNIQMSIPATDLAEWNAAIEKLLQSRTLKYYNPGWGVDRKGYGLVY